MLYINLSASNEAILASLTWIGDDVIMVSNVFGFTFHMCDFLFWMLFSKANNYNFHIPNVIFHPQWVFKYASRHTINPCNQLQQEFFLRIYYLFIP